MKKLSQFLIYVSFLFAGITNGNLCKAQAYIPILSDSSTWFFTNHFFGFATDMYFASQDTVINNLNYKVLDGFHFNKNAFLREDTVGRKVYYRQTLNFRANQDVLIYDFNLTVGDSMTLYNPNVGGYSDSAGMFTLDSINTITTLAGPRKMYFLSGPDDINGHPLLAEWIEGIGSTYSINSGGARGELYDKGENNCMFKNTVHVYETAISQEVGSCEIYTVGEDEISSKPITIYPNPVTDRLYVDHLYDSDLVLSLHSLNGHTFEISESKAGTYDLSEVPAGLYIAKLYLSGKVLLSTKLIIE